MDCAADRYRSRFGRSVPDGTEFRTDVTGALGMNCAVLLAPTVSCTGDSAIANERACNERGELGAHFMLSRSALADNHQQPSSKTMPYSARNSGLSFLLPASGYPLDNQADNQTTTNVNRFTTPTPFSAHFGCRWLQLSCRLSPKLFFRVSDNQAITPIVN